MPTPFDTQSAAILDFYRHLRPSFRMGEGISIMNPYTVPATWELASRFYEKFYADSRPRTYIFGINPGRHGAGVTGVPFTDPIRMADKCGIPNDWRRQAELSSVFVYDMIDGYGGVKAFYDQFYITAVFPLGFTRHGKNLNYYDDKELIKTAEPFILECIRQQLATIPTGSTCYCLGEGENFKQFSRINDRHGFFTKIIPLPHPRWVMQYRRKKVKEYVELYVEKLKNPGSAGSAA
jgi:Domain of unknown function (DUF4918)